ncbi:MAG TPA: 50S ribosomal protein L21 [Candidatus Coprenecus pullicola]|nr:50S ribosomal protein L21 [Candidatus Coprenecus pullicola]
MYAIVDIAGQQFKVEKGKKIFVNRLEGEKGASLDFGKVLLTDDNGSVKVGTPYVDGASVKATILDHVKADKVLVFKKRRRKGYQKLNGHRQCLTQILIDEIA